IQANARGQDFLGLLLSDTSNLMKYLKELNMTQFSNPTRKIGNSIKSCLKNIRSFINKTKKYIKG
ncbi:MAG: hypothetical protein U9R43_16810, partial [Thermodesulfobacteriota bacterium]|nr:hypothetical protein [Thermodesulfobacteriota bacterium]